MNADDEILLDAAGRLLDGASTGWEQLESGLSDSARDVLHELRAVAAIHNVTRTLSDAHVLQDDRTPTSWGHLHIVERVGSGAFGTVYRAWDPKLDREVALKLLSRYGLSADSIIREGRLLARVHHPNVVTIFGADTIAGRAGLWMELVQGETLEQHVARDGPLPHAHVVDIARQLCEALGAVHAAGLVHRDVKTTNIMLTSTGRVVLMDFGAGALSSFDDTALAGTPLYLAPEVFDKRAASTQSDIYALGVVLYRLLTASFPIERSSLEEVRAAHRMGISAPDIREHGVVVPRRLAAAVMKALSPDPATRWPSAEALGAALSERKRPYLTGVAALVPLACAAGIVAWSSGRLGTRGDQGTAATASPGARQQLTTPRSQRFNLPADAVYFERSWSPDGHYFSYTDDDGSVRLLSVDDNQARTIVTANGAQLAQATACSPGGSRVAYQWWSERNTYELRVVDSRSGAVRVLLRDDTVQNITPVEWSHSGGTLLALEEVRSGLNRLVLVNPVTAAVTVVREFEGSSPVGMTLSPDGAFVAYDAPEPAPSSLRLLHVINADGSGDHVLLPNTDVSDWAPLWTADGRGLFFLSDRSGAPDGWYVAMTGSSAAGEPLVAVRNLARVRLLGLSSGDRLFYQLQTGAFEIYEASTDPRSTAPPQRLGGRFHGENIGPSYSTDGSRLAYISVRNRYGVQRQNVLVIRDLGTGDERELRPITGLGFAPPRWSSDNRLLLVRGGDPVSGGGIRAIDAATGAIREFVARVNARDETDWGPMGWDATPDGAVYEQAHRGLVRHSVATGDETVIYPYTPGQPHGRIHRFAYSRSGTLAFSAIARTTTSLFVLEASGARMLVTVAHPRGVVVQGWSGDETWIYYTINPASPGPHELWRVRASDGIAERLPLTIDGATQINPSSIHPFKPLIAYTAGTPRSEIWTMDGFLPR